MTDPQQKNVSKSREGGYTIIESLVAMIVVSVLMIAIAPVMAFSVATRVQARRTELATQAARAYMDALRTGAVRPKGSNPASPVGFPTFHATEPPPAPGSVTGLYCYNLDKDPACDGSKEFVVQGVRDVDTNPTETGYSLTVRVYRADADAAGPLISEQQSVANAGLGNRNAPLVVMKTQIPPTTGGASAYRSLCTRTKGCQ